MTLTLPDDPALDGLAESDIRIDLACALFAGGRISRSVGARMAGMERFDFDAELVRRKIPSFTEEMLEEDLATLRMLMEIKNEVRALPREQQRELACDLIEEISGEEFPAGDAILHEVNSRLEAHERTPSRLTTLDEIQARIRELKGRG